MGAASSHDRALGWELHFRPLDEGVCSCVVPCDAEGRVDLDALGERMRERYLCARALVGGHYARPVVKPAH